MAYFVGQTEPKKRLVKIYVSYLSRPIDADTVEVLLQAAVLEGVEVDHLVTLVPPDL